MALRDFLELDLHKAPPDHSTISRTRRLIALEAHRAVFTWVLQCLSTAGLVKGKTIGVDATTLEANGVAQHRPTRQRRQLRRMSHATREGLGDRHTDARGSGAH